MCMYPFGFVKHLLSEHLFVARHDVGHWKYKAKYDLVPVLKGLSVEQRNRLTHPEL